jgi:hypothetical protein
MTILLYILASIAGYLAFGYLIAGSLALSGISPIAPYDSGANRTEYTDAMFLWPSVVMFAVLYLIGKIVLFFFRKCYNLFWWVDKN